jgi:hypothetical protein
VVVAHNLRFDDRFLAAELARAGQSAPHLVAICSAVDAAASSKARATPCSPCIGLRHRNGSRTPTPPSATAAHSRHSCHGFWRMLSPRCGSPDRPRAHHARPPTRPAASSPGLRDCRDARTAISAPSPAASRLARTIRLSRKPHGSTSLPWRDHHRPTSYRVEASLVVELAVDAAVDLVRGRPVWRHPAKLERIRAEWHPMDLSPLSSDAWSA